MIKTMKNRLTKIEQEAMEELKFRLSKKYPGIDIILFGSKVRGDSSVNSDIDLLILVGEPVTSDIEDGINDITYDIELKYNLIFGKIIESKLFWESTLAGKMPLHWEIEREGVVL
ncbi:nucleotidyltransferase domain-containing protein [bacterium]|nr:nucleotidyltransferase domain-containing protein [bacterium]